MGGLTGSNDLKLNRERFLTERSVRQCERLVREVSKASFFRVFRSSLDKTLGQLSLAIFTELV